MPQAAGSIGAVLARAVERLADLSGAEPRLEAELLLAHLLDKPRSHLYAWPEKILPHELRSAFDVLIARRLAGEPVAYLTGEREFWSLSLRVTPDTLIPRADTETLVERALALIPEESRWRVADLGTGSGAIAAAIARERPRCRITATDRSAAALSVARGNFRQLGLDNVRVRSGDWLEALRGVPPFDLILSNPPYIALDDPHLQAPALRHEPRSALTAGPEGLDDIVRIVDDARGHLKAGGWLLLEHGFRQGEAVRARLQQAGYGQVTTHRDLHGNERVTIGQRG